jgi:hypothetical protein
MASPVFFPFPRRGTWIGKDHYQGSDDLQPGNYHGVQIRMVAGYREPVHRKEELLAEGGFELLIFGLCGPTWAQEFGMHPATTVSRPPQYNALHLAT